MRSALSALRWARDKNAQIRCEVSIPDAPAGRAARRLRNAGRWRQFVDAITRHKVSNKFRSKSFKTKGDAPRKVSQKSRGSFSDFRLLFSNFRPHLLAAATASAQSSQAQVIAPDLAARLAKFKPVKMPFDSTNLTEREKQMVAKLVDAAGLLDCIFWRQSDPEGLKLYLSLANSTNPQDKMLRELLKINGGRFDQIDDNKPFVGTDPAPPGRGFYLPQETRASLEQRISSGRFEKSAVYSPYTIEKICAIGTNEEYWGPCFDPYHAAFGDFRESDGGGPPRSRGSQRRSRLRKLPAPARRCPAQRRLLQERSRVDGPRESEIRRRLRAIRNLSRRAPRRENLLRRVHHDSQRRRKQKTRRVSEVRARFAGIASARARRFAVRTRTALTDGSCGRDLSLRRPAARLSGRRGQSPERSAHPSGKGLEENLLEELHGCPRELRNPAAGWAPDASGPGEDGHRRRHSRFRDPPRNLPRTRPHLRARNQDRHSRSDRPAIFGASRNRKPTSPA